MFRPLPLSQIRPFLPVSLSLLPALAGCASPGQPHAPSLHLPAPVTALQAERVGPAVHLTWTTPDETTDDQPLRGPITAVLCRDSVPATQPVTECLRAGSFPVVPGSSAADDLLTGPLLVGPPTLLRYRVQLFNAAGRAAGPSAPVYSVAGAAPAALGPLHLSATRQGAVITWVPGADAVSVELKRTLIASTPKPAVRSTPNPGRQVPPGAPGAPAARPPVGKAAPAEVTLRAQAGNSDESLHASEDLQTPDRLRDVGGVLDPGLVPLNIYRYVGQRVRTVSFPAPAGSTPTKSGEGHAAPGPGGNLVLELRGLPSPPAEFTYRDVFPPKPPTGLAAIASPGDGPASTPQAAVDLSWEPGLEADLLGYNVYRADAPGGSFHRLNVVPLPGPAFYDPEVLPGRSYVYRVTAVDRTGNESPPSQSLPQTVPRP